MARSLRSLTFLKAVEYARRAEQFKALELVLAAPPDSTLYHLRRAKRGAF
tara:strand:+ start:267 stop:416 length:150 start_codon:yes stop_codon:yes gene_type:complete